MGVVAGKRRKIHAGNGAQQPCHLPLLLHRAPRNQALRPALHRAGIHANVFYPVQIEWHTAVGLQLAFLDRRGMRLGNTAFEVGFHRHNCSPLTRSVTIIMRLCGVRY